MKQLLFTLVAVLISMATLNAQQIAVVNGSGSTSVYDTLDEAIEGATSGCTIYLPGGGFQINTPFDKKITIMGISHKADSENEDGNTLISGNIDLKPGSDGSAIMGIYLTGNINIGVEGLVKNVTVKYCNINSVQVKSGHCPGIYINQCYLRNPSAFNNSNVTFTNNISHCIESAEGGTINYNIFVGGNGYYGSCVLFSGTSTSKYNICNTYGVSCDDTGSEIIDFGNFINDQGITPRSNFHFKDDYQGNRNIGVYAGGTGFNDGGLPPMPHIISKNVAEQTDAKGNLRIEVKVKAN